jgi:hypothetical protein
MSKPTAKLTCATHGGGDISHKTGICTACWNERYENFWDAVALFVEEGGHTRAGGPEAIGKAMTPVDQAMLRLCELATFSHPAVRAAENGEAT